MSDVAGPEGETKGKSSRIRYEPAEGAAGRKAASEGGTEQMLHVEGGLWAGQSLNPATCHLPGLSSLEKSLVSFRSTEHPVQISTLSNRD